jgi:DNA topoisomerase-1
VQHGKTYASLGRDDEVLEIGQNRAIDLVVAKETGVGGRGGPRGDPGREIGADPDTGKMIVVKAGRFGAYVTNGATNATLPKDLDQTAMTLEDAVSLLRAREAAGGGKKPAARKSAAKKVEKSAKPATVAKTGGGKAKPATRKATAAKAKTARKAAG